MSAFADQNALEYWLVEQGVTAGKASTVSATLFSRGYDSRLSLRGVTVQELKEYAGVAGPVARELSNALALGKEEQTSVSVAGTATATEDISLAWIGATSKKKVLNTAKDMQEHAIL